MKKFTFKCISVFLSLTLLSAQSFNVYAGGLNTCSFSLEESEFSFDEKVIDAELNDLNELDAYVEANEGITFSELEKDGSVLLTDIENTVSPMGLPADNSNAPLGIPSFLWGCVLGIIGILLVYLISEENNEETKKALWGCLVGTGVSMLFYIVLVGAAASTSTY